MKKVLALVLAVMMISTVAFAEKVSTVNPGGSVDVDIDGANGGVEKIYASSTSASLSGDIMTIGEKYLYLTSEQMSGEKPLPTDDDISEDLLDKDSGYGKVTIAQSGGAGDDLTSSVFTEEWTKIKNKLSADKIDKLPAALKSRAITGPVINSIGDVIFRDVTNENYTVSSIRVTQGKNYVTGVKIYDGDQAAKVEFLDDLGITNPVEFDVSYTLRGKGKMVIKDEDEAIRYLVYTGKLAFVGDRVTIPSVKFTAHGKLGYGKVTVSIGEEGDQDLDGLPEGIEKDKDVVEFKRDTKNDIGSVSRTSRAGSYVADAILTEDYDEGLTLEARVYSGDKLFFNVDYKPDREIVGSLADHDGDLDFYAFTKQKDYVTFNSNVKLIFNDATEDDQVYKVVDKKLLPIGSYDEDEGCWVVKERILGTYVISDINLDNYIIESGEIANPDTGANDVVGIATALAAVALVSAAAISLKK